VITVRKRGKVYQADYYHDGVRHRPTLHTRDPVVARAMAQKIEMELLTGSRGQPISWNEFSDEFFAWIAPHIKPSTEKGYRYTAKRLGQYLAAESIPRLSDIDSVVITRFMEMRRKEKHPSTKRTMGPGGVKFELRVLHRLFSRAVERGYLHANPVDVKNLKSAHGETQPFSQAEITAMLNLPYTNERPDLKAMILLFLNTGLRRGDVIALRKEMIQKDSLMLKTKKRGTRVFLKLRPETVAALKEHMAHLNEPQRKSAYLFPAQSGAMMRNNVYRRLRCVWRRANIPHGYPHRFRDTFAVRLLSKGASLYDVAKLLGISVRTAELHYAPFSTELRERAERLVERLDFVS
jgi:integrase